MSDITSISQDRLMADWTMLCETIGIRLAGTDGEWAAADYILNSFKGAGCDRAFIETFPCNSLRHSFGTVSAKEGGRWAPADTRVLTGSPSTPGGKPVTGELAWLEMPEQAHRLKKDSLKGKIAVIFGPLPDKIDHHRRLVNAAPRAVIHIDERIPFSWPKNDGTYPLWVKKYGYPPTVTVPYVDAWRWRKTGVTRAKVTVDIDMVNAESTNVVAELTGSDSASGMILIGAHHDSQANNVGADDNASGVVSLLELARLLKPVKRRRSIRFVSFGAEEQLSVGSAAYVALHKSEMKHISLMINIDSIASVLGHSEMLCNGRKELLDFALKHLNRSGLYPITRESVSPFSDHFPFTVYGVPALWFYRENMPGGRWQHHSEFDNLDNISPAVVEQILTAVFNLTIKAANMKTLPFPRGMAPALRKQTLQFADTLYGIKTGKSRKR